MRILFPFMHPDSPAPEVPGLKRLDPGYEDQPVPEAFRPDGLPLDPAAARRLVADSVNYGQQFKTPGEMAWHGLQDDGTKPETERVIQAELLSRLSGAGDDKGDPARAQAQFVLLLAWRREADLGEQIGLEARLAQGRERFDQGLGENEGGEDDPDQKAISLATAGLGDLLDQDQTAASWKTLLAAMARFLPQDAVLVCDRPAVVEAWQEAGVELEPVRDDDLPSGTLQGRAPLGRLVGRTLAAGLAGDEGRELSVLVPPTATNK